jgi:hypothetical protein
MNIPKMNGPGGGLEKWIKYGIIGGVLAAPVYYGLTYVNAIANLINSIAWNTAEAIPAVLAIALVSSPIWNSTIRTALVNWIDITSLAIAKSVVKINPVGWLENQFRELGNLIADLEGVITNFRQMIERLKDEHNKNKSAMVRSSALLDAPERDFQRIIDDFEAETIGFDFEKLDKYTEALNARNEQSLAETQAVSLEDRNKELEGLATDFVAIIKFMLEMRADMQQVQQHLKHEIATKRQKWELQESMWHLLKQAHKFSRNTLKNMLTEYAGQYVDQRYSDAIAAFRSYKDQGSDVLMQAGQNRRIASVRAKEILTKYRQAKAVAGQTPDQIVGAHSSPVRTSSVRQ